MKQVFSVFFLLLAAHVALGTTGGKETAEAASSRPQNQRLGECPLIKRPPCVTGQCRDTCQNDNRCPKSQKCCSNGCCKSCTSQILKPGFCPLSNPSNVTICLAECEGDGDCPRNQKCCVNGCHRRCVAPLSRKPGTCPANPNPPTKPCTVPCRKCDSSQCSGDEICCRNGCCEECTVPKEIQRPKPGFCPLNLPSNISTICLAECSFDADCPNTQKCCVNGCHRRCVPALSKKPGTCPANPNPTRPSDCAAVLCLACNSSTCAGDKICCRSGCCDVCTIPTELAPKPKPGTCPANPKPTRPSDCAAVLCRACNSSACPGDQICCRNGCCDVCTKPVNTPKPGYCPLFLGGPVSRPTDCVKECSNDRDCKGTDKCCVDGCIQKCVPALTRKPGVCPANPNPTTVPTSCLCIGCNSTACPGRQICCLNGCCEICTEPLVIRPIGKREIVDLPVHV